MIAIDWPTVACGRGRENGLTLLLSNALHHMKGFNGARLKESMVIRLTTGGIHKVSLW